MRRLYIAAPFTFFRIRFFYIILRSSCESWAYRSRIRWRSADTMIARSLLLSLFLFCGKMYAACTTRHSINTRSRTRLYIGSRSVRVRSLFSARRRVFIRSKGRLYVLPHVTQVYSYRLVFYEHLSRPAETCTGRDLSTQIGLMNSLRDNVRKSTWVELQAICCIALSRDVCGTPGKKRDLYSRDSHFLYIEIRGATRTNSYRILFVYESIFDEILHNRSTVQMYRSPV